MTAAVILIALGAGNIALYAATHSPFNLGLGIVLCALSIPAYLKGAR